jgi:hypothetical protein
MLLLVISSESGGIGRRARLRIWYRKVWGFESPLSHQKIIAKSGGRDVITASKGMNKA